jgi:glycosyltransferase involved in cell wall biosynthesis
MGPLWTRLAVHLGQRFDAVTVANKPLQKRYGGSVIPHARDPSALKPATAEEKAAARRRFGLDSNAAVVLFFGTPRRHKGVVEIADAVATLSDDLLPCFVVAGDIPHAEQKNGLERDLRSALPPERLALLGNQPFEQAREVLALADLVVLPSEGEVAAFQSPAKLSDALAMGLPVLVSEAAPLRDVVARGWAVGLEHDHLADQLEAWLTDRDGRAQLGQRARAGFLEEFTVAGVAARLAETGTGSASPVALDAELAGVLKALGMPGMH